MKNIKTYEEFGSRTFEEFLKNNNNINKLTTMLDCSIQYLIDLDGIEKLTNLENLWCYDNKISSLKPILNSTKLVSLDFWGNDITSLEHISNLTNLFNLKCSKNNLTSLEGIENLINLKNLYCDDNNISSLDGIENLNKIEFFHCQANKITSLKPISNLTKLKEFHCYNNPIDWVDYIDKQGNKWYIVLPKSIKFLTSDKFKSIDQYWKFMDKTQPVAISRKFNF